MWRPMDSWLGDLTTTQRYMHLNPAAIEGAIRTSAAGSRLQTCANARWRSTLAGRLLRSL